MATAKKTTTPKKTDNPKTAAAKTKPAPEPEKPKAEPAKTTNPTPGVRKNNTARPYLAGQVLAKYGFEVGITDEMVEELDGMYKNSNPRESRNALTYGYHVARGYADSAKN